MDASYSCPGSVVAVHEKGGFITIKRVLFFSALL
jgi:hypothetical protein